MSDHRWCLFLVHLMPCSDKKLMSLPESNGVRSMLRRWNRLWVFQNHIEAYPYLLFKKFFQAHFRELWKEMSVMETMISHCSDIKVISHSTANPVSTDFCSVQFMPWIIMWMAWVGAFFCCWLNKAEEIVFFDSFCR